MQWAEIAHEKTLGFFAFYGKNIRTSYDEHHDLSQRKFGYIFMNELRNIFNRTNSLGELFVVSKNNIVNKTCFQGTGYVILSRVHTANLFLSTLHSPNCFVASELHWLSMYFNYRLEQTFADVALSRCVARDFSAMHYALMRQHVSKKSIMRQSKIRCEKSAGAYAPKISQNRDSPNKYVAAKSLTFSFLLVISANRLNVWTTSLVSCACDEASNIKWISSNASQFEITRQRWRLLKAS